MSGSPNIVGKGILLGMPVHLTEDGGCQGANLVADVLLTYLLIPLCGFNGAVMRYEGSYWPALWLWLTDDVEDWS